ncbi:MAG: response regulator transcription factor [Syntrophobacteraceae bacterium]|nr:response regulator transcription factor [Syntrophobacteraceae bacterium]
MQEIKRIVLAEDHAILREGLRMLLSAQSSFEVVGEAGDGREAVQLVKSLKPDLVIMDLSMPVLDGVGATREIKKISPSTKILVLTVHKTEERILDALAAGADGYVLKDASHYELMLAIEEVFSGRGSIGASIPQKLIVGYLEGGKRIKSRTSWQTLTPRERQIIKMIAAGSKNKEIADCLSISIKTVEKHRANLMRKLDLHSAASITHFAMEKGLTKNSDSPEDCA